MAAAATPVDAMMRSRVLDYVPCFIEGTPWENLGVRWVSRRFIGSLLSWDEKLAAKKECVAAVGRTLERDVTIARLGSSNDHMPMIIIAAR